VPTDGGSKLFKRRNSGEGLRFTPLPRINQLRKSPSAASHANKVNKISYFTVKACLPLAEVAADHEVRPVQAALDDVRNSLVDCVRRPPERITCDPKKFAVVSVRYCNGYNE